MDVDDDNCIGSFDCLHIPFGNYLEPTPETEKEAIFEISAISCVLLLIHVLFFVIVSWHLAFKVAERGLNFINSFVSSFDGREFLGEQEQRFLQSSLSSVRETSHKISSSQNTVQCLEDKINQILGSVELQKAVRSTDVSHEKDSKAITSESEKPKKTDIVVWDRNSEELSTLLSLHITSTIRARYILPTYQKPKKYQLQIMTAPGFKEMTINVVVILGLLVLIYIAFNVVD